MREDRIVVGLNEYDGIGYREQDYGGSSWFSDEVTCDIVR